MTVLCWYVPVLLLQPPPAAIAAGAGAGAAAAAVAAALTWLYLPAATWQGMRPDTGMPSVVRMLILRGLLVCGQGKGAVSENTTHKQS
jgi:hypothetical protein